MQILITGASGFIGQHLLSALLAKGYQVVGCVRHPQRWQTRFPAVKWLKCDYTKANNPNDWLPLLQNIDVIINAVGIIREQRRQSFADLHTHAPIALFQAAKQVGIRKILQISALGTNENAQTNYHLSKRTADEALLALQIDAVILYPSIVIGRGGGSSTLFAALAVLPVLPVIGQGEQHIQPIYINDFKAVVLVLLQNWPTGGKKLDLVGAKAITFPQLLISIRNWLNLKPAPTFSIPLVLMQLLAKANNWLGIGPLTSESLAMLVQGNCADPTPLAATTGVKPLSVTASLQDSPATTADIWAARLFFLRPLLRFSIGFVWLFTGIVSAFFYPLEESYKLLAAVGITGIWAPFMLYGAAAFDGLLGIATLANYRISIVVALQFGLIISYTAIISLTLPELWLHPFGPITKNLPLIIATLIMLVLEKK